MANPHRNARDGVNDYLERVRVAWLTARRAGVKRSAARVRRVFLLRVIYPRFAARLYPRRTVEIPERVRDLEPFVVRDLSEWDGTIRLLNTKPFAIRARVNWNANPIGHTLWQFRLHEWEWAYPLIRRAQNESDAANELVALLQDYFANVPFGHPVACEPYPLSRRLVVWCEALRVLCKTQQPFASTLASEMERGARMLRDNIEHDLDNNHVIANAKALAFVGTLFEQSYAQKGFDLLWEQLRVQVRADGVHVENSTTYHFLVWRDAIETCTLAQQYAIEIPKDVLARLAAMKNFSDALRYSDETYPLLNDSAKEQDKIEMVLDSFEKNFPEKNFFQTNRSPLFLFQNSGYSILRADDTQLVFDAGALGPDWCPGHGHADTLSFELFAFGHARIVDVGTYQYQAGAWRDFFRGTAAHNTIQVDGLDSSEVSSSFRVGRMANARMWAENNWVCGEHDGYTRLREPITHARKIQLRDANTILIRDEIRGRGEHAYVSRFHLAPNARANVLDKKARVVFEDDVLMEIDFENVEGLLEIQQGWYSPTWYTKFPIAVVELKWRGEPPFEIETTITNVTGFGDELHR